MIPRTPNRQISLYDRPEILQFSRAQFTELGQWLKEIDNATTLHPVADETELQLSRNAQTSRGCYRYTSYAFRQISQLLAGGLSKLLPDISGTIPVSPDREFLIDGGLAVEFWNNLVSLRFPILRNYRVIRNEQHRQIEGIMGLNHQYLDNLSLFNAINETLRADRPDVSFYSGLLIGRRICLWYRSETPLFVVDMGDGAWPFYDGYYFTNGEAAGTSVRGTLAVFSPAGVCLGPYKKYGSRLVHAGKDFQQRLGAMFSEVTQREVPAAVLARGAGSLIKQPLGFTANMAKKERAEHRQKLIHSLDTIGVSKTLASEVVDLGLSHKRLHGRVGAEEELQDVSRIYPRRKLIDLFIPLMHVARQIDLGGREKVEQAAFEILMGRLILPRDQTHASIAQKEIGTQSREYHPESDGRDQSDELSSETEVQSS